MEEYNELNASKLKINFSAMLHNEEYDKITDVVKRTTTESSNVVDALNEAFIEWLDGVRLIVSEYVSSSLRDSLEAFPENIDYTIKNVEDILSYSEDDSDILLFLVTFLKSGLLKKGYLPKVKNKDISVFFRWDYSFEFENGWGRWVWQHHEGEYEVCTNLDIVLHDIMVS